MTTPVDTPTPAEAAVAAARAEIVARGEPDPFTGETVDPLPSGQEGEIEVLGDDDQAEELEEEQAQEVLDTPAPDADTEEADELLVGLEVEDEEPVVEATEPDLYELPGIDEPKSLQELKDGFLRNDHYTQGRQELARERERLAKAEEFYQALQKHPVEVARQLAEAAKLIEPGATPTQVVDLALRPEADVESEIERRVTEALESHPDIQAAQDLLLMQWVQSELERIEKDVFEGKTLGPKSRDAILKEADRLQTDDLETVARSLKSKADEKARATEKMKRAAPVKPTGKASSTSVTDAPETAVDAVLLAAQQSGVKIDPSKLNFQ